MKSFTKNLKIVVGILLFIPFIAQAQTGIIVGELPIEGYPRAPSFYEFMAHYQHIFPLAVVLFPLFLGFFFRRKFLFVFHSLFIGIFFLIGVFGSLFSGFFLGNFTINLLLLLGYLSTFTFLSADLLKNFSWVKKRQELLERWGIVDRVFFWIGAYFLFGLFLILLSVISDTSVVEKFVDIFGEAFMFLGYIFPAFFLWFVSYKAQKLPIKVLEYPKQEYFYFFLGLMIFIAAFVIDFYCQKSWC